MYTINYRLCVISTLIVFFFNSPTSNQLGKTINSVLELFLESGLSYQSALVPPDSNHNSLLYDNFFATRISLNLSSSVELLDLLSYKVNLHLIVKNPHLISQPVGYFLIFYLTTPSLSLNLTLLSC